MLQNLSGRNSFKDFIVQIEIIVQTKSVSWLSWIRIFVLGNKSNGFIPLFASNMTTIERPKKGLEFDIWTVDDNFFEIINSHDKVFLIKSLTQS